MLLDDVAAPGGGSSRPLYSYLSGSDNDEDDHEARRSRRRRRNDDWRVQTTGGDDDDDDDDGMSSASWVRSGTGSESEPAADDHHTRLGHEAVGSRVYTRINDLGLLAHLLSSTMSLSTSSLSLSVIH